MTRRRRGMPGDLDDRLAAVDDALAAQSTTTDDGTNAPGGDAFGETEGAPGTGPGERASGTEGASHSRESPGETRSSEDSLDGVGGADSGSTSVDDGSASRRDAVDADAPSRVDAVDEKGPSRVDAVARDVSALGDRVAELEAAVEALRGYAGSVRAVNDRVEERADAAVATTESLEDRVDELERRLEQTPPADHRPRGSARGGGRVPDGSTGGDSNDRRDSRAGESEHRGRADGSTQRAGRTGTASAGGGMDRNPRAPYGAVDDEAPGDDDERGLLGRLRDAW